MDHKEVGRMWDANAEAWTTLARQGCDIYRDFLNTPAFMAMLPDVSGLRGLDIGCGEGHNTRMLARRGASMTAIDISKKFIAFAQDKEREEPLGIVYRAASAIELPFADETFDFATAFMSLMDMPDQDKALREAHRVLKPRGFLQFSITHPCFMTTRWRWVRDEAGARVAIECGDYFEGADGQVDEWIFTGATQEQRAEFSKFRVPRFLRTLSAWLNTILDAGFTLERFEEPSADDETLKQCPHLADTRIVAYFLLIRCRKA